MTINVVIEPVRDTEPPILESSTGEDFLFNYL